MPRPRALVVDATLTLASGTAERDAAGAMLTTIPTRRRATLGADKAYDTRGFVTQCRARDVTPHVAQNTRRRRSAIDTRTTRHRGYAISQRLPKRAEEIFGWMKTIGLMRKRRGGAVRGARAEPAPSAEIGGELRDGGLALRFFSLAAPDHDRVVLVEREHGVDLARGTRATDDVDASTGVR